MRQIRKGRLLGPWWVALVLTAAAGCAVNPVTHQREFMLVSQAQEKDLGQQTDREIVQSYGAYEEQALSVYVDQLGERLARVSHRPDLGYRFKVLDTPVVNAFAVPGGYVYLTRGILAYINSEAELAGVIGHEIGHITARHSAQQLSRAQVAQLGFGVGSILSSTFRDFADLAQIGVGLLFMRFSRDNERQADALGVEYASRAGYDASHMARFFETLERKQPQSDRSGLPAWFSTHPNPPDRIAAVQTDTRSWQQRLGKDRWIVNREGYLKALDGLVYGEDPRQGYVEQDVFYHPDLTFRFSVPSGWKVQNTPRKIEIRSPQGDALLVMSLVNAAGPVQAAEAFVRQTRASVLLSQAATVGGLSAHRLIADVASDSGTLRTASAFIMKDGRIYGFLGLSSVQRFSAYQGEFDGVMGNFGRLTDSRKLAVKPDRMRVRTASRAGNLRDVLTGLGVAQDGLEKTALLNGMHLGSVVERGQLLKVVEKGR